MRSLDGRQMGTRAGIGIHGIRVLPQAKRGLTKEGSLTKTGGENAASRRL